MNDYRRNIFIFLSAIALFLLVYFLASQPRDTTSQNRIETRYETVAVEGALQPIPKIVAIDKDWVALGKALFHSPLLSKDNSISCASCHLISQGGDDGFPVSVGIEGNTGVRNSPTVLNSALNFRQFWDGRSSSLAAQVSGPIHNPIEMGSNFEQIIKKLSASKTFAKAFKVLSPKGVTKENIILAITTFEESLLTPNSALDLYLLGDENALNPQQKRGLKKFTQFGCITCHQGRNIGGNLFQRIGRIDQAPTQLLQDKGKYQLTSNIDDLHVYKVPSLRNVTKTAPYFHNGSIETLPEAVQLMAKMQLGLTLADDDIDDIVALFSAFEGQLQELNNE